MDKRIAQNSSSLYSALLSLWLTMAIFLLASFADAADQGELGKTSKASIDISVTVNQTLNTISPTELLLNDFQTANSAIPFCVAHHGYSQNAHVPYELIVDSFTTVNNTTSKRTLPFNVFLQKKNNQKSKKQLIQGVSISSESNLKVSENLKSSCLNSGMQLHIEENILEQNSSNTDSLGVMVLVISPT